MQTAIEGLRPGDAENELLRVALVYARSGLRVFPLAWPVDYEGNPDAPDAAHDWRCSCGKDCSSPAKHPLTPNGVLDGTIDESRIRGWWGKWPSANVGVATGRHAGATTGIAVVDYDPRHDPTGGTQDFIWTLPATPGVRTGGGGEHLYFKIDAEQRNRTGLKPGLDIRGDGGYVVAPPSIHISGREYEWDVLTQDLPMVLLPEIVKDSVPQAVAVAPGEPELREGSRNSTLTSIGGTMRRRGASQAEIEAALLVRNAEQCNPPLSENEVRSIAESCARYEPDYAASAPVAAPLLMSHSSSEFMAMKIADPAYLIDRVLPENGLAFVAGPSGSFKSFMVLEMGFAIATGQAFLGRWSVPAPRAVLYVQGESSRGAFKRRLERARDRFGDAPNLYVISNEPLLLEDPVTVDKLRFELSHIQPRLLILDPLRSFTASDEDKAVTMGPIVRTLRELRDAFNTAIVVVHHTIKSGTGQSFTELSGSGAIGAAKDAALLMHRIGSEPRSTVRFYLKEDENLPDIQVQFNPATSALQVIDQDQLIHEALQAREAVSRADSGLEYEPGWVRD